MRIDMHIDMAVGSQQKGAATCVMDTCAMDTCAMDTCAMDTCAMDTYTMEMYRWSWYWLWRAMEMYRLKVHEVMLVLSMHRKVSDEC